MRESRVTLLNEFSRYSGIKMLVDTEIEMPFRGPPRSMIASARKRGVLAGIVRVTPSSFTWDGHLIEVHEAWLQQLTELQQSSSKRAQLYFTLKIDDELQNSINCPDWSNTLIFAEDGTNYVLRNTHLRLEHLQCWRLW
jgi:hypothetical protein